MLYLCGMNILIVSATRGEIEPLLKKLSIKEELDTGLMSYSYKNQNVDVLVTGVGMTATAFYLGKSLSKKYDLAINLGVAGSFDRTLNLGGVVNINADRFGDMGAEAGDDFITLAEMDLQNLNEYPYQNGEIVNVSAINNQIINVLPKVSGITVNTVHGNETSIKNVMARYNPAVESMEGAAFLFACLTEKIPCVQVRAISNYVERRNREAWNIPLAIENLNKKAVEILDEF